MVNAALIRSSIVIAETRSSSAARAASADALRRGRRIGGWLPDMRKECAAEAPGASRDASPAAKKAAILPDLA